MNLSDIQKLLAAQDTFAGLSGEHLTFLASNVAEESFADGQVVARQGEHADRFLLVLEGELVVEVPALSGPKLEITRLGPGQIFGWSWLIEPYKWHFNARAVGSIRVLDFDGPAILRHCEEDPRFGYLLFKRFSALMAKRLESAQRKMMDEWSPAGFA
jgi:CRP/FNR family transcriptional regulator, cyclic AMP receptor protein